MEPTPLPKIFAFPTATPLAAGLQLNTPNTPSTSNANPLAALTRKTRLRRPAEIVNLVVASPRGSRALESNLALTLALCLALSLALTLALDLGLSWGRARNAIANVAIDVRAVLRMQQVPHEHQRVVGAGREHTAAAGRPFDCVNGRGVAAELEQGLARLPHVEDPDDLAIGGEGGEEVAVMRAGG